jgi:hypothetical protein
MTVILLAGYHLRFTYDHCWQVTQGEPTVESTKAVRLSEKAAFLMQEPSTRRPY